MLRSEEERVRKKARIKKKLADYWHQQSEAAQRLKRDEVKMAALLDQLQPMCFAMQPWVQMQESFYHVDSSKFAALALATIDASTQRVWAVSFY